VQSAARDVIIPSMRICVVGSGAWGSALAKLLGDRGHTVTMWSHDEALARRIEEERENRAFLPAARFAESFHCTADLEAAVRGAEVVISVTASHFVRGVMARAAPHLAPEAVVVSASKGIEVDTLCTMHEALTQVLPGPIAGRLAILSGPSFAREVGAGLPTAVVVASRHLAVARRLQEAFSGRTFRVYTSDDVVGVELGGALKNVIALAAGCADGLGLGHNARAALITRGLAEIARLAVHKGANPLTLSGLAGMGDLVLTCTGDLSRNRYVGMELGRGRKLADILAGMAEVAEGVRTTRSAHALARKLAVDMPITAMAHRVLYEDHAAVEAVVELMTRGLRHELE
jgi:glycerol-3-phosphate dehydrogenase (NAD(P)+)